VNVRTIALVAIALAIAVAEIVRPTHFAPKRLSHATGLAVPGSGLDSNVLDSLPPIDKQALGSIDFVQYELAGKTVSITTQRAIPHVARIVFIGWCGDPDVVGTGAGAFLSVDGRTRIDVSSGLGGYRPDVVKYYSSSLLAHSGFRITVDAAAIGPGTHEIQFGVIARDRRGYFTLGGPIDLTIV
jgi:hypothetical protein